MNKKSKGKVLAELLPPETPTLKSQMGALEKLVAEKVHEILANRDSEHLLLRPFFDSRRVSIELRRLQTVPELYKWSEYFRRFGCLICETKRTRHAACGMCPTCYLRTFGRLKRIVAERLQSIGVQKFNCDAASVAQEALSDALHALPSAATEDVT